MANNESSKTKKVFKIKGHKEIPGLVNDGMNTPVPDTNPTPVVSESEAVLFKQADNPLGDPDKA